MIRAECHSDDFIMRTQFDATEWFESASDVEILALARCGWGGDYPADRVASDLAEREAGYEQIVAVYTYLDLIAGTSRECGFECHVNEVDASLWISTYRPHLLAPPEVEDVHLWYEAQIKKLCGCSD